MARNYSSVVEPKTLTASVSSSDTQITLNNVTGLPSRPYVLVLNPDTVKEEAVLVTVDQTGVTSPTLKVQRAIEASGGLGTAQTHSVGNTVKHMIVGSDLQIVHDHFSNDNTTTGTAHGATGGVVGRTNSQTLTNKTINLTDNTLSGTVTQFNTALSDDNFATETQLNTSNTKISNNTPVGSLIMFAGSSAPTGWLLCNGQSLSTTGTYAALHAAIGYTYGGSGASFNVPDLLGRAPIGVGTGSGLSARALADKVGVESVTLTSAQSGVPAHGHTATVTDPGHTHTGTTSPETVSLAVIAAAGASTTRVTSGSTGSGQTTMSTGSHDHTFTTASRVTSVTVSNAQNTAADAASAHTNMQPSLAVNFIIKY